MSHDRDRAPNIDLRQAGADPRLAATLDAVREAYQLCDALPQREHWRLAQVLRRHLRAVLRCLARANASVHDADRCAELERAMLHCAHLDTLWTLCAGSLEWLPRDAAERQRERWLSLREQLAGEAGGLARAMTLRAGRGQPDVALFLTHSLPDTYAGPRPPVTPVELSIASSSPPPPTPAPLCSLASLSVTSIESSISSHTANTAPLKVTREARRRRLTARTTAPLRQRDQHPAVDIVERTDEIDSGATISAEEAWTEGLGTWVEDLGTEPPTAPTLLPASSEGGPR